MKRLGAFLLAAAVAASAAAAGTVDLLGGDALVRLFHNSFDGDDQVCTAAETLRVSVEEPALHLPTAAAALALHLAADVFCGDSPANGVLFALAASEGAPDAVSLRLLEGCRGVALDGGRLGRIEFEAPADVRQQQQRQQEGQAVWRLELTLGLASGAPPQLCLGGVVLPPRRAAAALLEVLAAAPAGRLLGGGVTLGAPRDALPNARADVSAFFLLAADPPPRARPSPLPSPLPACAAAAALRLEAAANGAPTLEVSLPLEAATYFAGDRVEVRAAAADPDGDALRLKATFFGAPPEGCAAEQCGDAEASADGPTLSAAAVFPRPGRFIIRVTAADGRGGSATADAAVLVRRRGDAAGAAPCCRTSPWVVGRQHGRPLHEAEFRVPAALAAARRGLGWSDEYLQGEDMEAERLFDWSMLAPAAAASATHLPLRRATCHGARLAGGGSPRLRGATDAGRADAHGHGKAVALVPAGFAWASADEVGCESHWTGWEKDSPYARPRPRAAGGTCSTACTAAGTRRLVAEAGMYDRLAEAVAAASHGRLSLAPAPVVADTVLVPRGQQPGDSAFDYYERPVREALAAAGTPHWFFIGLVPPNFSVPPPFPAWAGGGSRGAVVTSCFASLHYAVHELGHRLGFRHADTLLLAGDAAAAPADPAGDGVAGAGGYGDALDAMACCGGDHGLWNRVAAGWVGVGEAERLVLPAAEVSGPARGVERRLVLWPFDRPESRGRLMAVALRRAPGEALLLGFRSAPHWPDAGAAGVDPSAWRHNVAGLTVEVVRSEGGAWSDKAVLDFNVLHGDWPSALPPAPGAAARRGNFAAMRPAHAWHDAASGLLVAFEAVGPCDARAGLAVHNYTMRHFQGLGVERPAADGHAPADFSGFAALQCAHVTVSTAAPAPPRGRLALALELLPQGGSGAGVEGGAPGAAGRSSSRRRLLLQAAANSSAPCWVRLSWGAGDRPRSVVALDGLNRTAWAVVDPRGGALLMPAPRGGGAFSVHALAPDGRAARVGVAAGARGAAVLRWKSYHPTRLEEWEERVDAACGGGGACGCALAAGRENGGGGGGGAYIALVAAAAALAAALAALAVEAAWLGPRRRLRRWAAAGPKGSAAAPA